MRHILELAQKLHGRSGVGMNGLAPLSYTTIRHYRKECGLPRFTEKAIDALIMVDSVMLFPGEPEQVAE